jgi:integral membrane protein
VTVAVAVGGLLGAFGWMSARTLGHAWVLGAAIPAAVAIVVALRWRCSPSQDDTRHTATIRWFAWLARAEGLSLLLLFGVYMPLKHGAGIVLDGGQGWFGWMHGVLQLLYLVALVVTARVHDWGIARQAAGFVASLLPFGTFVFERRVRIH